MPSPVAVPERVTIGGDTSIPRLISGLWQLAGGHDEKVDIDTAAREMERLTSSELDCFDMADHYGDAGTASFIESSFLTCR